MRAGPPGEQPRSVPTFRWLYVVLALAAAGALMIGQPHGSPPTPAPPIVEQNQVALGVYGRPVLQSGSTSVDVPETLASVHSLGADTYAYLIGPAPLGRSSPSRGQWDGLAQFASEASDQGIDVLVYLVPPTEAPDPQTYEPFGWDYVTWARQVATLARTHPAIRGVVIDDLGTNVVGRSSHGFAFSSDTLAAMRHELAAAGHLSLYGVLYYQDLFGSRSIDPAVIDSLDGVVFPYTGRAGSSAAANTTDPTYAAPQASAVGDLLQCRGSGSCTQINFAPAQTGVPSSATTTTMGSCQPGAACSITVELSDSSWGDASGETALEVWADGRRVARRVVRSPVARTVTVDLAPGLQGERAKQVSVRVQPLLTDDAYYSVRIHSMAGSGAGWVAKGTARWVGTDGVDTSVGAGRQWLFMAYASRLGAETQDVSSVYVKQVLAALTRVWPVARPAGCLLYLVPTPSGTSDTDSELVRAEVGAFFSGVRALPPGR